MDFTYRRRTPGGRSKISGTVGGTLRVAADFGTVPRRRYVLPGSRAWRTARRAGAVTVR